MRTLNLLPYRAAQRSQKQRNQGLAVVLSLGIGMAVSGVYAGWVHLQLAGQLQRNALDQTQLQHSRQQLAQLQEQDAAVKALQQDVSRLKHMHSEGVQMLNVLLELSQHWREGAHLQSLEQRKEHVVLEGAALTHMHVAALMQSLRTHGRWLGTPVLQEVQAHTSPRSQTTAPASWVRFRMELPMIAAQPTELVVSAHHQEMP